MLGREVLLPVTLIANPPEEISVVTVPFISNLRDNLRDAHRRVREATQATAKSQKIYTTTVEPNQPNLSSTNWFASIGQSLQLE